MSTTTSLYRYLGCGLPDIYLENGYDIVPSPYGDGVTVHDLDGLHLAIGAAIVQNPAPLTGHEFRFLRQELELSQAGLGALIGRDEQSVARWEKGQTMNGVDPVADRMIRVLFQSTKLANKRYPVLEFLRRLESTPPVSKSLRAKETGNTWAAMPAAKCA